MGGTKWDQWLPRCPKGPAQIRLQRIWGRNDGSKAVLWPCWFAVRFFSEMEIENTEKDGKGRRGARGEGTKTLELQTKTAPMSGHVQGRRGGGHPEPGESC